MNRAEGEVLAGRHLEPYRQRSYADLLRLLTTPEPFEGNSPSGVAYSGEVCALWDDQPHHNLRVWSDVSWGGWSDFHPVTVQFIIAPDGSFVGE